MRVAFFLLAALVTSGCSFLPGREAVVTPNPSPIYSVKLYDSMVAPILLECRVYADVEREGSSYVSAVPMLVLDNFDCRFGQSYASREWVNDRVLRFKYVYEESEDYDVVVVTNKTDRLIKAIRVDTGDIHLALDIHPHETQTFETRHRQGTRWVSAYGVFEKAKNIYGGQDLTPDPRKGQRKICVNVQDDNIEIKNSGKEEVHESGKC